MVQVIGQGRIQPKSFGQQIGEGVSRLASGTTNHFVEQKERELEADAVEKMTGLNIRNIKDPKIRQAFVESALKGQEYESQKISKLGAIQNSGIGQFLGMGKQQNDQLQGNNIQTDQQGLIPEEAIYQAELLGERGLAHQLRERNKQIISQKQHEESLNLKKQESQRKERVLSPEFQREKQINAAQAKIDTDYNKQLQQSATQHKIKNDTLNRLESLNKKGVTGKPYEKILEKSGLVALTSEGRREFAADVKNLITDIRSILGAQFTGFEFQTILNAYPSADFSKEANSAIIKNLKEFQDIRHKELEISKELKKENGGKIPIDFQSQVNERLEEYANSRLPEIKANTYEIMKEEYGIPKENILMFSPDGDPLNVHPSEVEKYESLGATIYPVGS